MYKDSFKHVFDCFKEKYPKKKGIANFKHAPLMK